MSYAMFARLARDTDLRARIDACCVEQARVFRNDQRPDIVALADAVLRGMPPGALALYIAHSPGWDARYAEGGQDAISDADILASTQGAWPTVAALVHTEGEHAWSPSSPAASGEPVPPSPEGGTSRRPRAGSSSSTGQAARS